MRLTHCTIVLALISVSALPLPGATDTASGPVLGKLSDSSYWTFEKFRGEGAMEVAGSADGDVLAFSATGSAGMAASVRSRSFPVEPNARYAVTMQIRTEGLEPIDASLTGGAYVRFRDKQLLPGSYQPANAISK